MLKTALRPAWIAGLILALVVSAVFVLLGKWQMDNAASAPPPLTQTETPVPLTEHFRPGHAMLGTQADQVVTLSGRFVPGTDVLVHPRLQGQREGYWAVTALAVDGAPDGELIPVVRGWTDAPAATDPAPEGPVRLTGRLLPSEGPQPRGQERTEHGYVLANLSSAELVNLWDAPAYAGFVVAFDVASGGADGQAATDGQAAGAPAPAGGREVGAKAPGGELEPVWVGPQPQETTYNWMNIFYAIEWVVFAGFALYLWWRFLRDDVKREREEQELDRRWEADWRARELERRRAEAREAKRRAVEEYERFHGRTPATSSARPDASRSGTITASRPPSPQEDQ
ncbi:SURF1 family protein [Citricoccus sp. SGAir0253]|uniref:SURF1 family protein n=1 Tax=Citricoccus sp. SGAir0253 TaxID=2567881 RepID=UPI0010CD5D27|nr:SURF1 family protein [Citricoccus sp. SGAir0253]QCU77608.1 SURF1 family protein [Citricoccus sp. SGAir0253]